MNTTFRRRQRTVDERTGAGRARFAGGGRTEVVRRQTVMERGAGCLRQSGCLSALFRVPLGSVV